MVARSVVGQVTAATITITGTESLVISINDSPARVDNVQAVIRLIAAGKPVRRSNNNPLVKFSRPYHNLFSSLGQLVPVEAGEGLEVHTAIAGQVSLRKVHHTHGPPFRPCHLS